MGGRYFDWRGYIRYVVWLGVLLLLGWGAAHFARWWGDFALGH